MNSIEKKKHMNVSKKGNTAKEILVIGGVISVAALSVLTVGESSWYEKMTQEHDKQVADIQAEKNMKTKKHEEQARQERKTNEAQRRKGHALSTVLRVHNNLPLFGHIKKKVLSKAHALSLIALDKTLLQGDLPWDESWLEKIKALEGAEGTTVSLYNEMENDRDVQRHIQVLLREKYKIVFLYILGNTVYKITFKTSKNGLQFEGKKHSLVGEILQ